MPKLTPQSSTFVDDFTGEVMRKVAIDKAEPKPKVMVAPEREGWRCVGTMGNHGLYVRKPTWRR